MPNYFGPIPTAVWDLLLHTHCYGGLATQSDIARQLSAEVALCASCGWLSVISVDGLTYTNKWRITAPGLVALQHKEDFQA